MTIRYHWENMPCNVPSGSHTKVVRQDVDYDYEHAISFNDICDYLMPYSLTRKKDKTKDEITETQLARYYMEKVLWFLKDNGAIETEELENDEYFVEFLHERYEQNAMEEWEEYNDEY